jgi:hypothetical protein
MRNPERDCRLSPRPRPCGCPAVVHSRGMLRTTLRVFELRRVRAKGSSWSPKLTNKFLT